MNQSNSGIDIAVVVGEASGDWLAALAIEDLLANSNQSAQIVGSANSQTPQFFKGLHIEGVAGPRLRDLGVQALHQSEELSVRGYVEVLRHLPRLLKMRKGLVERWTQSKQPKLFLGVDAPDFNLDLELKLRQAGVPTIHLVCPSIWAWRMERIHKVKAACDHVLCIFPFETEILKDAGIPCTYVGHPMAAKIPLEPDTSMYREQLQIAPEKRVLAVLPGSRGAEVKYLGPTLVQACQLMIEQRPELEFISPLPNASLLGKFKAMIPSSLRSRWQLIEGQSHEVLGASDAVLLASGTATLEAMMFKKPMVIAYKMPWLSYRMMKNKVYMPYMGLPNILSREFVVPEFYQHFATPKVLCSKTLFQLENEDNRRHLKRLFTEHHRQLIRPTGELVAQVLRSYLN